MKIDFTLEQLLVFYRSTSNDGRKAVKEALGEKFSETIPVTERVKTYDDAVNELGEEHPFVVAANSAAWRYPEECNQDIVAYLKLRVVVAALNDGWKPEFTEDERRWFPWYRLYTKEEIDNLSEEDKEQVLLWGGPADDGSHCGLACADSGDAWSNSYSSVGSRLALKSEELADYAGNQFIELFAPFCFRPKPAENE